MKKELKHGGKRPGAGRKKGEPTKTLSYRVPENRSEVIDQKIRALLKRLLKS